MRTIPILIIAAIVIGSTATAYYFLRDNDSARRAEEAKPSIGSTATLDVQDTPIGDGRRDQLANPEQPRLIRLQEQVAALEAKLLNMETAVSAQSQRQAGSGPDKLVSNNGVETAKAHKRLIRLQEQVAALEARLLNMETAVSAQSQRQAGSGPDKLVSNNGAETAKARKWSDADFAQWMDAALDAGDFDRYATESVMEQAATSVATVPGINLADLQCGERFCRATLIPDTGERLNISELIGASPFMGSGTTFHGPDGSVRVYFVQPGQSLSELRSEAQTTAW